jgi:hypothetical protein
VNTFDGLQVAPSIKNMCTMADEVVLVLVMLNRVF